MIARIKKRFQRSRTYTAAAATFRDRYELVERQRAELLDRLRRLDQRVHAHPGHRRALTLLNERFRKAKVAQRIAILQAAEWLIGVLETMTMIT